MEKWALRLLKYNANSNCLGSALPYQLGQPPLGHHIIQSGGTVALPVICLT